MIERRKTPRKDWVIGKDDLGRSVLEWKVDHRHTARQQSDANAQTYNFLQKLNVPDLALEEDGRRGQPGRGRNPYDNARGPLRKTIATGSGQKNPARKEPGSN